MESKGKVALITGSSSGIGRGTAIEFASLGYKLIITGRNETNLEETKRLCIKASNQLLNDKDILIVVADLSKDEDIHKIINDSIEYFQKLDILINNAGIGKPLNPIELTPLSYFDDIMRVNVRSVFLLTQLAIPYIKKSKGNIINISSIAGIRAVPNSTPYAMSKAAIDHFTKTLALELAPYGIRVNSVNPAVIETDFFENRGEKDVEEYFRHSSGLHPIGRNGKVEDIAKAIKYLVSEDAGFVTGVNLPVDGARTLTCPR